MHTLKIWQVNITLNSAPFYKCIKEVIYSYFFNFIFILTMDFILQNSLNNIFMSFLDEKQMSGYNTNHID